MSDNDSQASEHQSDWEEWDDDETSPYRSLFSDAAFPTLEEVLAHDSQQHAFDLRQYRLQEGLESQYEVMKVVNYVRREVAEGRDPRPALATGGRPWADDAYLQAVLPEDELLLHDWEEEEGEEGQEGATGAAGASSRLAAENEALRGALGAMQALLLGEEGADTSLPAWKQQPTPEGMDPPAAAGPSSPSAAAGPAGAAPSQASRIDESYFSSYSFFDIHRDMLGDRVRTEAYRSALENNPGLMGGATVLDVGCGTGILSMFAARGGAARVVGVDGSEEISKYARAVCDANGLGAGSGGPVTVVTGRVEALGALPLGGEGDEGKADVLVSEWMGYVLLFESMLDSVLLARDRWLRPGGAVLPDIANIYIAAGGEGATGLGFWRDVYGFSMTPIRESIQASALKSALVRPVAAADILTEPALVRTLDLATMTAADQDFTAAFRLAAGAGPVACHALVVWFDTLFSARFCPEAPVELSTSPFGKPTHWAQTVLLLKSPITLAPAAVGAAGAAVAIQGTLSMARNKDKHRSLDIALQYSAVAADGSVGEAATCLYSMGVQED